MKKILAFLLITLLIFTVFSGCNTSSNSSAPATSTEGTDKMIRFSASSVDVDANASYLQEARYKALNEKFNFEIEFVPVSWDTWAERDRIWINSGDMPDVMFWDFQYNDYVNYTKQGVLKALPDDFAEKYPNLAKVVQRSGVEDVLRNVNDGKLYVIPNVIYQTPVTEIPIDQNVVFYRKDWAKELGFTFGSAITSAELIDYAQAVMDSNLGEGGAGKTIGITGTPANIYHTFIRPYNDYFDEFYHNGTEYVYGPFDDKTFEGIKNLSDIYKTGVIDRDFYTIKSLEHRDKFFTGKAAAMVDGSSVSHYAVEFSQLFKEANPDLDPFEAMGIAAVTDNDGVYHAINTVNYWSSSIFNADMDDDTMHRILSIMDYIATEEGQYLVYLGVEGEDYTKTGDTYDIKQDENGNPIVSQIKNYYWTKPILPDDWALHDPTINNDARNTVLEVFAAKEKNMSVRMMDYAYSFLATPEKMNFSLPVNDAITETLLTQGDLETEWAKWKDRADPKVQTVLDEINEALTNN